jgi:hypothetical protein
MALAGAGATVVLAWMSSTALDSGLHGGIDFRFLLLCGTASDSGNNKRD